MQRYDGIHHTALWIRGWERGGGRNRSAKSVANSGTQAFIAGEEEELVFLDRPAHHAAELLQLGWQLIAYSRDSRVRDAVSIFIRPWVEGVAGVPVLIAAKRVRRAMKSVGPRSNSHVHHGAGLPSELRLRIFLHLEFLDGVHGQDGRRIGQRTRHIGHWAGVPEIDIDHAVQHPAGFIGPNVVGALAPG